jgi:hypothetical protein
VTGVLAVATLATQQKPTFRLSVNTVEMYATVRADDGRLVTDLNREDFEIRDNGQAREVIRCSTKKYGPADSRRCGRRSMQR